MGGVNSVSAMDEKDGKKANLLKSQQEVVRLMLPVFYTPESIDVKERKLAVDGWNLIVTARSPEYLTRKGDPAFPHASCITFFYSTFYDRLFDIHPMSRSLFRNGMQSQGTFLVKMISLALSELDDPNKFDVTLIKLAEVHYFRGVKSVEYGIVGEVLLWTLKRVLGFETYTTAVHQAWLKIYCRMIRTVIPVAVALELRAGPSKEHNDRSYSASVAKSGLVQSVAAVPANVRDTTTLPQVQEEEEECGGTQQDQIARSPQCTHVVSRS